MDIRFIINEVDSGKSLKQISQEMGKSSGYISNYLMSKNINLPNKNKIFANRILKCIEKKEKPLDKQNIILDIKNKLSSSQISKKHNCSNVHVKNWVKKYIPKYYKQLVQNGLFRRDTSALGKPNKRWQNNKGKTYEEIYGPVKAKEMRQKRSVWLKQNNIRKFATKISKPQATLFAIVKTYYPTAEIEFEIPVSPTKNIYLDIAIPDKKICIEYDGIYWHEKNESTIAMKDKERDNFLLSKGWKVYRIRSYNNLNEEELKKEFFKLNLVHE